MLSANVVYYTRLEGVSSPTVSADQINTYRLVNSYIIILPLLIFCIAAANLTSYLSLSKVAKKTAQAVVSQTQEKTEKRSIIYGILFTVVGLVFCAVFALNGIVLGQLQGVSLPADVTAEGLRKIYLANLYILVFPALLAVVGLALVFKVVHARNERKEAEERYRAMTRARYP
jgi:ABC-type Fe3+ transport system permease subunit